MNNHEAKCWINGNIKPASEASISVYDHGFLYGDGVFEGIRFYHGKSFRLQAHLLRLQDSAQAIALTLPMPLADLAQAVQNTIAAFAGDNGYIRLIITRGKGCLGINPKNCNEPTIVIIADALTMVDEHKRKQGVDVITASTRKLPMDSLDPRIKSLNYLNHIQARIEANYANADEALMLNAQGMVAEGTADNVFIEKHGALITPPTSDGALAGITRACIIEVAKQGGVKVHEQSIAPYDVYTADACFLTGTGAEIIPVARVDGRKLTSCPSPMFAKLETLFQQQIEKECKL